MHDIRKLVTPTRACLRLKKSVCTLQLFGKKISVCLPTIYKSNRVCNSLLTKYQLRLRVQIDSENHCEKACRFHSVPLALEQKTTLYRTSTNSHI